MSLSKKIANWQKADLISDSQADAIVAFENTQNRPKILYGLLSLAIFCIGLGMVSLVAANWQIIPAWCKLGLDLAILAILASGIINSFDKNVNLRMEALIVAYALIIIASIGLVGQIYQLQPQGYMAYFVWALLTSPLLFFTKKMLLPIVWVPVFIFSFLDCLAKSDWVYNLYNVVEKTFPFALSLYSILAMAIVYVFFKKISAQRLPKLQEAWKFWLAIVVVGNVVLMDMLAGNQWGGLLINGLSEYSYNYTVIAVLLSGIVGLTVLNHIWKNSSLLSTIMISLTFFGLIYTSLPDYKISFQLWGLCLSLSLLLLVVQYAQKNGLPKLLNVATALIGFRLLAVYLQVFGSLMTTGLGLVSSGGLLLVLIWGLKKIRTLKKEHK